MSETTSVMISVIIPTCARPALLRRVLDCLAPGAQSFPASQYEVVVSDDAQPSTLGESLVGAYPWARVIQGPARGPAANRNAGARAAHHPWLAFTDDDTEPRRDWLEAFAVAVRPGVDVYEGRTTCDGGFLSPLNHAPVNETGGRLWSCNFMVSAARFAAVGGFDEGFPFPHMEDQDLRVRLDASGAGRVFVPGAVVNHPPRRQPWGTRLGAYRESEVRFHVKHYGRPEPRRSLFWRTIRYRVGVVRSTPKSLDSVAALCSLAAELGHVARHVGEWERRARAEFGQGGHDREKRPRAG